MTVEAWAELVDLITTGAAAKGDTKIAPSLLIYELAGIVAPDERDRLCRAVTAVATEGRVALQFIPKF